MIIEKPTIVDKVWGYEKIIVNNDLYCGKLLYLKKGFKCSYHFHKLKTEDFFLLSGLVALVVEDETYFLTTYRGSINIPPHTKHSFIGLHKATILEVSTTDHTKDSYRESESTQCQQEEIDKYMEQYRSELV